ncbi:unnamed protein product [Calypogeia fissa]
MATTASPQRVLGPLESATIGALSGVIEVLLQQPSVTIKNAIQDKQPISWNPRVLYRGVLVNATSMAPICALQFAVNDILERTVKGPLNSAQRAGFAATAGVVSSMVSGPAELLMIQQQKTGASLFEQLKKVKNDHGWLALTRGLVPTVVRESIYTATYLGVSPLLQERLMVGSYLSHKAMLAMFLAALVSGTAAALITQPFDTIKTRMQANLDLPHYRKMRSTVKAIIAEGGFKSLYSGFIPRTQRVMCAVFILGESKTLLTEFYFKYINRASN